jgi:hypothetical protein
MDYETVNCALGGGTPGGDSNDYILFNSVTAFGPGLLRPKRVSRLTFWVENNQGGTLKFYASMNGGTNFDQVGGNTAVAASASGDVSGPYDFPVDPYPDVKLVWTNGGSAQTTWRGSITLVVGDRALAK